MNDPRFPIGRFARSQGLSEDERQGFIQEIRDLPAELASAVSGLTPHQLDTPYRPGGWTVRQVVHHLADSHLNSYIRFKLAATEEEPVITDYDEAAWAELSDARGGDVELSLTLLSALHGRWSRFLSSLPEGDFQRGFQHPEKGRMTLELSLQLYAWHGRHHVAHIAGLRERSGW